MNQRTALLCGGGTGGHITPTLHVAHALKRSDPEIRLIYVIERNSDFAELVEDCEDIDKVYYINAGKFRRYVGQGFISRLLDVKTNFKNFGDLFKIAAGFFQSRRILSREKPQVIFAKGGFVVVPIGFAGHLRDIPIITHDSDNVPGLANRIIGRWALKRLVANEQTAKAYGGDRTMVVGVPVDERFVPSTPESQIEARKTLGLYTESVQLLIVGGSIGAQRMNAAVRELMIRVISEITQVQITWVVGGANLNNEEQWLEKQSDEVKSKVLIRSFINNIYQWVVASDVMISRGGATSVAEIVSAAKPAIIVPAAFLPDSVQVGNAEMLREAGAAVVVHELDDILQYGGDLAYEAIRLLGSPDERAKMSEACAKLSHGNVAQVVAGLILEAAG